MKRVNFKIHPLTLTVFSLFLVLFSSISLVNHYYFRTNTCDLGVNLHALYNFATFQEHTYTLWLNFPNEPEINFFGDHFSPITFLYIPFFYILGDYSLLIIQLIAVLFGGLGIYRLISLKTEDEAFRNLFILHFFGIWAIYSAMAFDFHNNVIAAMLIPWIFYYYKKENFRGLVIISLIVILTKENMSLWLAFIYLGIYINDRFSLFKTRPLFFSLLPVLSLIWFFIIVGYVMPALKEGNANFQLERYNQFGTSPFEIIGYIIGHPRELFASLFEAKTGNELYFGVKSEFYFMLLVSGGFLFFRKAGYLVMIIPLIAQKMLSDDVALWGISYQYSIEFAPVLTIGLMDTATQLPSRRKKYILAIAVLSSTWFFNIASMEHRIAPYLNKSTIQFYDMSRFSSAWNLREQHKVLNNIPEKAVVSAHSSLVPHLCSRKKLYTFPVTEDAEYIVLFKEPESTYPVSPEEYQKLMASLRTSGVYKETYNNHNLIIFKRK